ncbi:L,D-transpeptidase family protein [Qipengyuania gaetbuli]|uniref:L,D-transpeptidase family protein n=1 Tax=Qipengyuania gaetbuli TaxID=266952 RepID=UPI001CFDB6D6|nr:L,D-transpeptidase family protein [Qipengyuania gaetbuli]
MTAILKWVGGTTFVIALGIAALAYGVSSQAEPEAIAVPAAASIEPEGAILAKLEADARRPFTIRRILPIEGPIKYGEWHWDDEGVPEGPLLITVDLQARTISIFRDGYEIGAAAVMLGTDEHPTPTGTFPILTKERHNVSEKYGNAPMPWTLRLTWDGIAIHGGSEVENGYASHGCVAIPDPLAAKLFDIAQKGDKVIITDGKRIGVGDPII